MKKKVFTHINNNTCHECGEDGLWLIEHESTISQLNKNGSIVSSFPDECDVKLVCPNCGKEYKNVSKRGMNFYIKSELPPVVKVMKDFNPFQS